jgi:hypothetical protein
MKSDVQDDPRTMATVSPAWIAEHATDDREEHSLPPPELEHGQVIDGNTREWLRRSTLMWNSLNGDDPGV